MSFYQDIQLLAGLGLTELATGPERGSDYYSFRKHSVREALERRIAQAASKGRRNIRMTLPDRQMNEAILDELASEGFGIHYIDGLTAHRYNYLIVW